VACAFWLNRLLPFDMPTRADWEVRGFFLVWLLCLLHPLLSSQRMAWVQQMAAAALLFALLPLLNALTGGNALPVALAGGQWSVAGVDVLLLILAAVHGAALWWLLAGRRKPCVSP